MGYKSKWTKSKKTKKKTTKQIATSNAKKINSLIKDNTIKYFEVTDLERYAINDPINSLGQIDGGGTPTPAVYNLTTHLVPTTQIVSAGPPAVFINPNLAREDRFITLNHISLHCRWSCSVGSVQPTDPLNYCNMMIVLDREPRTAAGLPNPTVLTDILDTRAGYALPNTDHNLYFYQNDNIGEHQRYEVLKRIRIKIGPDQQNVAQTLAPYNYPSVQVNQSGSLATRYTNINLKKKYRISYDENNLETNKALKLLVWTDSRVLAHPLFTFQARISFSE